MIGIGPSVFDYDEVKRRHEELLRKSEARRRFRRAGLPEPSVVRDIAMQMSRLLIWAGTWLKERCAAGAAGHEFGMAAPVRR